MNRMVELNKSPTSEGKVKLPRDEELIGGGMFGDVFRFKEGKHYFAVKKILKQQLKHNIEQERELLELVHHRHIIKYLYSYTEGSVLCIVMEYADRLVMIELTFSRMT